MRPTEKADHNFKLAINRSRRAQRKDPDLYYILLCMTCGHGFTMQAVRDIYQCLSRVERKLDRLLKDR